MGIATKEQPYGVCDRCGKRSERAYYGTEWGGYSLLREKRHAVVGDEIVTSIFDILICRDCQDALVAFLTQPLVNLADSISDGAATVPLRVAGSIPVDSAAAPATAESATQAAVETAAPTAPRRPRKQTTPAAATPRTVARRPRPAVGSTGDTSPRAAASTKKSA